MLFGMNTTKIKLRENTIRKKRTIRRMSDESIPNIKAKKLWIIPRCENLLKQNFTTTSPRKTLRKESKNTRKTYLLYQKIAFIGTSKAFTADELNIIETNEKTGAGVGAGDQKKSC